MNRDGRYVLFVGDLREFLRVEAGGYGNGVLKFPRIRKGDETDWGLSFGAEPMVLRVSLATYKRTKTGADIRGNVGARGVKGTDFPVYGVAVAEVTCSAAGP
jgi:hypothetical protein